ncbi:MAG: ATP-binding protein [Chloroflexi bacterium]|nr:ATP-binding protein [Chloroflexota bacterium]
MNQECLRIACSYEEIAKACEFAQNAALEAGSNDLEAYHCYLAIDEACTNIVEHGSRTSELPGACIEICSYVEDRQLVLTLTDDGQPFDPLSLPDPDPTAGMDARASGGWGIYFIKRLMDDIRYAYEDGHNHLILTKRFEGAAEGPIAHPVSDLTPFTVVDRDGRQVLLTGFGRYDAHSVSRLGEEINVWTERGRSQFILDMESVTHLSSGGLKHLVSIWQRLRERRARLILTSLPPHLHELLEMSGLNLIFVTATTVEQADALLRN